jgi:hypothetical protein
MSPFLCMKLNVNAVLTREAEKKAEVKPLPKVKIQSGPPKRATVAVKPMHPGKDKSTTPATSDKDILLRDLWCEMSSIKKARGKLSTRTAYLVKELEEKLRKENPAAAEAFLIGELTMSELKDHYAKIQAYIEQGTAVFDKIRHVDQYGTLPAAAPVLLRESDTQVDAVHHEIRRLDDLIYKTNKKLTTGKPKNKERIGTWREKLALAEARRDDLKHKLKTMQYEARAERTGA